jgi:hypothetical protein
MPAMLAQCAIREARNVDGGAAVKSENRAQAVPTRAVLGPDGMAGTLRLLGGDLQDRDTILP